MKKKLAFLLFLGVFACKILGFVKESEKVLHIPGEEEWTQVEEKEEDVPGAYEVQIKTLKIDSVPSSMARFHLTLLDESNFIRKGFTLGKVKGLTLSRVAEWEKLADSIYKIVEESARPEGYDRHINLLKGAHSFAKKHITELHNVFGSHKENKKKYGGGAYQQDFLTKKESVNETVFYKLLRDLVKKKLSLGDVVPVNQRVKVEEAIEEELNLLRDTMKASEDHINNLKNIVLLELPGGLVEQNRSALLLTSTAAAYSSVLKKLKREIEGLLNVKATVLLHFTEQEVLNLFYPEQAERAAQVKVRKEVEAYNAADIYRVTTSQGIPLFSVPVLISEAKADWIWIENYKQFERLVDVAIELAEFDFFTQATTLNKVVPFIDEMQKRYEKYFKKGATKVDIVQGISLNSKAKKQLMADRAEAKTLLAEIREIQSGALEKIMKVAPKSWAKSLEKVKNAKDIFSQYKRFLKDYTSMKFNDFTKKYKLQNVESATAMISKLEKVAHIMERKIAKGKNGDRKKNLRLVENIMMKVRESFDLPIISEKIKATKKKNAMIIFAQATAYIVALEKLKGELASLHYYVDPAAKAAEVYGK